MSTAFATIRRRNSSFLLDRHYRHPVHHNLVTSSSSRLIVQSPGGNYPQVPIFHAWTCPIRRPLTLYASPGMPLPAPLPGGGITPPPASPVFPGTPNGGVGPPTQPPNAGWPHHVFWCYSNVLNPYGPSETAGAGASPSGSPSPPAPGGTPTGGGTTPGGGAPMPPVSSPPVPFGVNSNGLAIVLLGSGAFDEVDCSDPPGQDAKGVIVVFEEICPQGRRWEHVAISNGDGTYNSKNGLSPHTPAMAWGELNSIYGGASRPNCKQNYRCFRKVQP